MWEGLDVGEGVDVIDIRPILHSASFCVFSVSCFIIKLSPLYLHAQ